MSYNLTIEQANELFTRLGVEAAVVAEAEAGAAEPNYDELITTIRPEAPEPTGGGAVNEEAVKARVIGAHMGTLRSLLSQNFGVKRADLDGLDLKDMVPKLKTLVTGRYTNTEADLRQQLEEANNSLNALEERLTTEWQKKLDDANDKYEERDVQDRFAAVLNKIPRSGGDVLSQAKMLLKEAKSEYIVKYNPVTKQNEFYDRNNPDQKIMDGKNPLTDESFGNKFVDSLGIRVSGTQHINPLDLKNGGQGGQGGQSGVQNVDTPKPDPNKSAIDRMKDKINAQLEEAQ